jgi:CheY-like chemotaxis protein
VSEHPPTTILVVDDDIDMRLLVRAVVDLANDGLTIVGEAADGIEAVDAWRALDGPPIPDVIVLDNRMPRRSGIEVAQQILSERPDQLIVLYSAYLDDRVRAQATDVGITSCLSKEELADLPELIRCLRAT